MRNCIVSLVIFNSILFEFHLKNLYSLKHRSGFVGCASLVENMVGGGELNSHASNVTTLKVRAFQTCKYKTILK